LESLPEWLSRLSSVTRLSARKLTRGFAPQPHGWFAFVGEDSNLEFSRMGLSKRYAMSSRCILREGLSLSRRGLSVASGGFVAVPYKTFF
jgi:hypothetical protein